MRRDWGRMMVCGVAIGALRACGGGSDAGGQPDDAEQSDDIGQSESTEASDADPADSNANDSDSGADDSPAVASAREGLSNSVEVPLASGGVMVAGIECGPDGAHLLIVGASGLTVGEEHDAEIEPNQGQARFFVQENGDGYAGYQSRFDEASYTLTWPNIDDGLTLTVEGCGS